MLNQTKPGRWIAVMLLTLGVSAAFAQELRGGTLKSVQGKVMIVSGDVQRVAVSGDRLSEAERIITGPGAGTALTLKDGTVVSVGPGTTLDLSRAQFDARTQNGSILISLLQGSVRVVTGLLGKLHPEQIKIITPTSVVGVRGTDFIVEVP